MKRIVSAGPDKSEVAEAAFTSDACKAAFTLLGDAERDMQIVMGFE